jgi:hypothetical protein
MVLNKVSDFRCHQSPANTDTLGNR